MPEVTLALRKIKEDVLSCRKCPLYKSRNYPVIGQGSHQARIIFIGEAPGANEDKTGRPFCGQAGAVLDKLLNSVMLRREEVYIANILKCRPPNNRDPLESEISSCSGYLLKQLEIIRPEIVCCLGNFSTRFIMDEFGLSGQITRMNKIHGRVFSAPVDFDNKVHIIPFYHPAAATYNPKIMEVMLQDFLVLKKLTNGNRFG